MNLRSTVHHSITARLDPKQLMPLTKRSSTRGIDQSSAHLGRMGTAVWDAATQHNPNPNLHGAKEACKVRLIPVWPTFSRPNNGHWKRGYSPSMEGPFSNDRYDSRTRQIRSMFSTIKRDAGGDRGGETIWAMLWRARAECNGAYWVPVRLRFGFGKRPSFFIPTTKMP